MPLISSTLESQIKPKIAEAAKAAFLAVTNEGKDMEESDPSSLATTFGDEFANSLAPSLATAIDAYIKTALVTVLVTSLGAPAVGTLS